MDKKTNMKADQFWSVPEKYPTPGLEELAIEVSYTDTGIEVPDGEEFAHLCLLAELTN
jgi:hypothetical protein